MNNAASHDLQSLRRVIIDHPEDLDARRVYADFLCESSDPRGDFILRQIQLEESELWSPAYIEAKLESENLLLEHREAWETEWKQLLLEQFPADELPYRRANRGRRAEPTVSHEIGYAYRYGFIDEFRIGFSTAMQGIHLVRDAQPIRKIGLKGNFDDKTFTGHQAIRPIQRFDFNAVNDNNQFRSFMKFIDQQKTIELKARFVASVKDAATILQKAKFEKLKSLDLGSIKFSDEQLAKVASAPWFAKIEHLPLVGNKVGEKTAQALKKSKATQSLKSLSLKLTFTNDEVLKILANAGLPQLECLGLGWWFGSNPSDKGLEYLIQPDQVPALKALDLNSWTMTPSALRLIATSPHLANLKRFHIPDLIDEHVDLFNDSAITNLNFLDLSSLDLSASTLCRILNGNLGQGVKALDLSGVKSLGDSTAGVFESPAMDSLLYLDLSRGAISNETFEDLIYSNRLAKLQGLNLQGCGLSKRNIGALVDSNLTSLKHVRVALPANDELNTKIRRKNPGLRLHPTWI